MTVIRSRAGRILAAATLAAAGSLAYAGTAEAAVTCYGDYCSGQDPHATHCEDDAFSVASAPVSGTPYVLNLRWSPTCKTNWAQLAGDPNPSWIKAVQSTGYTQQYTFHNSVNSWSPMIYSPRLCVWAAAGLPGHEPETSCV